MNFQEAQRRTIKYGPVYDYDDPDRQAFIRDNAVSLLRERDGVIARQREAITNLEEHHASLKAQVRSLTKQLNEARKANSST